MKKNTTIILLLVSVALLLVQTGLGAEARTLRIGSTGAATMTLKRLGAGFSARNPDVSIEVIHGLGSAGAIEALASGALDLAVSARPLTPEETARSLTASRFCRTPLGFVTSHRKPPSFRSSELWDFYADPGSRWPDGTSVKVILRPRSDTDSMMLAKLSPQMSIVLDRLRMRPEIPIAATDQDNGRLVTSLPGTLATMTYTQAITEDLDVRFLTVDGVEPSLETLEEGTYVWERSFYFVSRDGSAAGDFIAFVRSSEGERILRESGNLAVSP